MAPRFHPAVLMPPWAVVLDLSTPGAADSPPPTPWAIGRYDEDRTIYTQALFAGARTVHMGVDLGQSYYKFHKIRVPIGPQGNEDIPPSSINENTPSDHYRI